MAVLFPQHPFVTEALQRAFQDASCGLENADSTQVEEALREFSGRRVLAIVDPADNSTQTPELLQRLSEHHVPFVLLSRNYKTSWLSWAIRYRAKGCISLNNTPAEIVSIVESLLDGRIKQYWAFEVRRQLDATGSCLKLNSDAIENVLTQRQLEVFIHLAEGKTVKEVACEMKLSQKSVDSHKYRIMQRLHLHDRVHLSRLAIREGYIDA
ncbi:response regulator transcription factor [Rubinisphaera margarita]|uniref:response regulator transcription factor n=1 Tax=Rubinisphaera margarita TaxID=2909586 RepID=UPI001EE8B03B|nr:response regulator transcription factor [Rubinisphaera margarita]MCG6154732.1 response regulator transcription factor [Rubinisphaera margarita]